MQLHVVMNGWGDEDLEVDQVVASFDDQDKIGNKVARAVKRFLRSVPVRKQRSRMTINLDAQWSESAPITARKKKRSKKAAAEEPSGG